LNKKDIELEKSNNLDLSLRKHSGNFGFVLNAFVNQVDNFYHLNNTGFTKELEHHDHDHEEEMESEEAEMPVFIYQAADVNLWGYEAEAIWKIDPAFELTFKTDSTRAEVNESAHLPRIPPRRYSISGEYQKNQCRTQLTAQHYATQNRFSALETATKSYSTLDVVVSYSFMPDVQLFMKAYNLTNEYARVHSSFLKDKAPLPARNIAVGISGQF
jgi:iron complex outermembrane recepter protein